MRFNVIFLLVPVVAGSLLLLPAYGANVLLDKSTYFFGEQISISGTVTVVQGQFVGLQILNPTKSDIVTIDQFLPNSDGTFSKKYKAQGPKWQTDGTYTVKIVYNQETIEKTFQFKKESTQGTSEPKSSTVTPTPTPTTKTPETKSVPPMETTDPKARVEGFPDPNKSPNYYLDRYYNEKVYKDWFNDTFPEFTIEEVVEYKNTHIPNFPDNENSPWYYVDRYNKEEQYKDWFDSQFPVTSIYDVLGYHESLFQKVPNWIKNNAKWWSAGLISDSDFLNGIEFLINENILVIPNLPESGSSNVQTVPTWIKNTAEWWADGLIDEIEFLKGIQFLVENGIIVV